VRTLSKSCCSLQLHPVAAHTQTPVTQTDITMTKALARVTLFCQRFGSCMGPSPCGVDLLTIRFADGGRSAPVTYCFHPTPADHPNRTTCVIQAKMPCVSVICAHQAAPKCQACCTRPPKERLGAFPRGRVRCPPMQIGISLAQVGRSIASHRSRMHAEPLDPRSISGSGQTSIRPGGRASRPWSRAALGG
jgi:hypothetical protein